MNTCSIFLKSCFNTTVSVELDGEYKGIAGVVRWFNKTSLHNHPAASQLTRLTKLRAHFSPPTLIYFVSFSFFLMTEDLFLHLFKRFYFSILALSLFFFMPQGGLGAAGRMDV